MPTISCLTSCSDLLVDTKGQETESWAVDDQVFPAVVDLNYGKHIVGIKQWHEKSGKIAQRYQFIYSDQSTSEFDDTNLKDG